MLFPYFIPVEPRSLSALEKSTIDRLLENMPLAYAEQIAGLQVVGRCGCGVCPTVFFQPHECGDHEVDLVTMAGKDKFGGLVAAVLMQKGGVISQLDYYSVDGHEPWEPPNAGTLSLWPNHG